jgi:hypothetical protein
MKPSSLLLSLFPAICTLAPLRADLVAYWPFTDAGSFTTDPYGGNVLTASGGAAHTGAGFSGGGLALDAAFSQYLAGTVRDLPAGNRAYTISARVKTTAGGGIIGWGNYGSNNQVNALRTNNNGFLNYWWSNDLFADAAPEDILDNN